MPATIVHLAFAGMLAAVLLGDAFGKKSLAIVLCVAAIPDLDSFIALYTAAGHRVALHNVWIPVIGTVLLWVDLNVRENSFVKEHWGDWGVRVIWVSLFCYLVAHIMLDLVDGSVNLFWPVYDQFYTLRGDVELSNQRGLVQTFSDSGLPLLEARGSIEDIRLSTGVDPDPDGTSSEPNPERTFPVFQAGWELVLFTVGTFVTIARFYIPYETEDSVTSDDRSDSERANEADTVGHN